MSNPSLCSWKPDIEHFVQNSNCTRCQYLYSGDRCSDTYASNYIVAYNTTRLIEGFFNFVCIAVIFERTYRFWKVNPHWKPYNSQRRVYTIALFFTFFMWPNIIDPHSYNDVVPIWLMTSTHSAYVVCLITICFEISYSLIICAYPLFKRRVTLMFHFYTASTVIAFLGFISLSLLQYFVNYWIFRSALLVFYIFYLYFIGIPLSVFSWRLYKSVSAGEILQQSRNTVARRRVTAILRIVACSNFFLIVITGLQSYVLYRTIQTKNTISGPNAYPPETPSLTDFLTKTLFNMFIWMCLFFSLYIFRHVSPPRTAGNYSHSVSSTLNAPGVNASKDNHCVAPMQLSLAQTNAPVDSQSALLVNVSAKDDECGITEDESH